MIATVLFLDLCAVTLGLYYVYRYLSARRPPLPPGPPGFPLVGNLFDIPKSSSCIKFTTYKEKYGRISSLSTMGKTIIVINDQTTAIDLLEKRSTIYSDRAVTPFMKM